jgi:hypothetical protein
MALKASLPVEPLYELARRKADNGDFTQVDFATMLGVSERAIHRWRERGGIPWTTADEAAISLGLHPMLVWGDAWLNVKGDFDAICAEVEQEMIDTIAAEGLED